MGQDRFWRRNLILATPAVVSGGIIGIVGGLYFGSIPLILLSSLILLMGYPMWKVITSQLGMWKRGIALDDYSAISAVEDALRVAERLGPGATVSTLLVDAGIKYLSTDLYGPVWARTVLPRGLPPGDRPLSAALPSAEGPAAATWHGRRPPGTTAL